MSEISVYKLNLILVMQQESKQKLKTLTCSTKVEWTLKMAGLRKFVWVDFRDFGESRANCFLVFSLYALLSFQLLALVCQCAHLSIGKKVKEPIFPKCLFFFKLKSSHH